MVRLEKLSLEERNYFENMTCPTFLTHPWVEGTLLSKRRVAIVSTAGLHHRDDRPFTLGPGDFYRIIPSDIAASDLVMSHVSTNFDRGGFQQDWNMVFPIERLRELVVEGFIGSLADFHYSFMGAHEPASIERQAREVAGFLKKDKVDAILLVPV